MSSILVPIAPSAVREGYSDWFGVVELDVKTGEEVWRFDAIEQGLERGKLVENGGTVEFRGFRPCSVERLDNGLTMVSGWSRVVFVDEDGDIVKTISDPIMNDIHETKLSRSGTYLVASTGADTILELDKDGNRIHEWYMWQHVFPSTKPKDYYPTELDITSNARVDINRSAFQPEQRYHLNFVEEVEKDIMLVCALNYGICLVDWKNDSIRKKLIDIGKCHNPHKIGDTYYICQSSDHRVIAADWRGMRKTVFEGGMNFVKDADPINRNGDWILTDSKNWRILLWNIDEDEPYKEFDLPDHSAPYEADYLDGGDSFA